ncbi:MAG: molybdopterin-dependent oxidoreductase [Desulfobacterales bacterium]|jgi:DMSO/TMAO reductase YedYZ molybdopterin-dependent catalytic subunit
MKRRQILKVLTAVGAWAVVAGSPLALLVRRSCAALRRRLLPADTDLGTLLFENPEYLDSRNLPITPIDKFGTMGLSENQVDLQRWRLTVGGAVARPSRFSYDQIMAMPAVSRDVLLICPGVFAYNARWRGISIWPLLEQAGVDRKTTYVDVGGPAGPYEKIQRFPLNEVQTNKAFLAYAVNESRLPEKHGFPLRAVAEGYVGSEWIKFVERIDAVITAPVPDDVNKKAAPVFVP